MHDVRRRHGVPHRTARGTLRTGLPTLLVTLLVGGCTGLASGPAATATTSGASTPSSVVSGPSSRTSTEPTPSAAATTAPTSSAPPSPAPTTSPTTSARPAGPEPSDGRPVVALLSIPAIGLTRLVVQPYAGWTDDRPGTAIQNGGRAASPNGPQGGTGAGGVGNYQVTAHRNSSTAAFFRLPALVDGDVVHVDAGNIRYTYRVTQTRETSFRSAASLAEQRAAVPGRPGVPATQAMITLSTCATQEDHAAGNHWADENDNPEHRIDKIGVLVESGPAPA